MPEVLSLGLVIGVGVLSRFLFDGFVNAMVGPGPNFIYFQDLLKYNNYSLTETIVAVIFKGITHPHTVPCRRGLAIMSLGVEVQPDVVSSICLLFAACSVAGLALGRNATGHMKV